MLDLPIVDEILARFEDTDAVVRRKAIRKAAGHVRDNDRLRIAVISVVGRDEERDPAARRAAFAAVAGLFGSDSLATRAVERSLHSRVPTTRRNAVKLIIQAAHAGDSSATRLLARNLTIRKDQVRAPLISAARELIDAGRGEELKEQLLQQVESGRVTDRILAADLLEAAAVAARDRAVQASEPSSTTSDGDTEADVPLGPSIPAPEARLGESVVWTIVRAVEESHLPPDADLVDTGEDPPLPEWLTVADFAPGEPPPAVVPVMPDPPDDPVAPEPEPRDPIDLLVQLLSGLRERELYVFAARSFTSEGRRTLASIATDFSVTRERIRQIESRANAKWRARFDRPDYQPLRDFAEKFSAHIGSAVPLSDERLSQVVDDFCGGLAPEQRTVVLRIFLDLAGYSQTEGWLMRLSPEDRDDLATSVAALFQQWPVVPRAELARVLGGHEVAADHVEAWCTQFNRLRFIDAGALPRGSSRDDFERLLRHRGEPASVPQLLAEARLTHLNPRGARYEAIDDPRFTRLDRTATLAHRDWGFKGYTHITDGLIEELERRGGVAPIGELCRVLAARYGVSTASVRGRTAAPIFMKTAAGELAFRTEDVPYEFKDDPATSGVCFWHEDHWSLRMLVTRNLLRGSGREVPAQFAAQLGCRPGGRQNVASAWGSVSLVWAEVTPKPAMGSVGPALRETGARVGDLLFVCHLPGGPEVDLRLVQRAIPGPAPADQRIAGELGLHTPIRSLNDVASALSVEHEGVPASIVWRDVQGAIEARPALDIGGLMAERFPEFAEPSDAVGAVDDAAAG